MTAARAEARANIALAKYWGKSDDALNLPAVPSVSITLDPLTTETEVIFDEALSEDVFTLDDAPAKAGELERVTALLDQVRRESGRTAHARVASRNHFPTAAGLASSASGFAALAGAARAAAGLPENLAVTSALARLASASAARSVYEGFVELPAGKPGDSSLAAQPLAPASHWDLRVLVAVTARGRKAVGSRDAMGISRQTSPFYPAWVGGAEARTQMIVRALLHRDFAALAPLVEASFVAMHAVAMSSEPPVYYWRPQSLAAFSRVRELRERDGLDVCATMDAGPHVKAICPAEVADAVREALEATPGILEVLVTRPGPGLQVWPGERFG